jgi:transposase
MGKHFDKEYKTQAARLVVEEGKKVSHLAEELNISPKTLSGWVSTYKNQRENGFIGSGNVHPDMKFQMDLEKRIKDLEEENEILKKAMHIFTKNPK